MRKPIFKPGKRCGGTYEITAPVRQSACCRPDPCTKEFRCLEADPMPASSGTD